MTTMITHGSGHSNKIALTLDDGPSDNTSQILKLLAKYRIKATFFLIGENVKKKPNTVKQIIKQGHEIGNHTYSHEDLPGSFFRTDENDILKTQKALNDLDIKTRLFRPTKGLAMKLWAGKIKHVIKDNEMEVVFASAYSRAKRPAERQLADIERHLRGGDIILLHDGDGTNIESDRWAKKTIKILPELIKYAKSRNLKFVTVSELLGF